MSFLTNQPSLQPLMVNNQHLETVHTIKLLGVYLKSDLKWIKHVTHICSKASKRLYALRLLKHNGVQWSDLRRVFCRFIRPVLEYTAQYGTLLYRIHSATKSTYPETCSENYSAKPVVSWEPKDLEAAYAYWKKRIVVHAFLQENLLWYFKQTL